MKLKDFEPSSIAITAACSSEWKIKGKKQLIKQLRSALIAEAKRLGTVKIINEVKKETWDPRNDSIVICTFYTFKCVSCGEEKTDIVVEEVCKDCEKIKDWLVSFTDASEDELK